MINLNIIGITGRKRHGKDTLGDYLVSNYGYTKIGFADALKEGCRHIFGFNDDQLYGNSKEIDDAFWKASPRKVLQYVGTDLFRNQLSKVLPEVKDDIWVKVVEKTILQNPDKKYVITDVRFNNELEFIKKYNGLTIKVQRDTLNNIDSHISESFIDELKTNYTIKNSGTIEELYEKLENVMDYNKYTKYKKICNFSEMHEILSSNTLYVFDIDETLMVYDEIDKDWWKNKLKTTNEELVLKEWINLIKNSSPKHTCKRSFDELTSYIDKNNILCLTARKEILKDITEQHLKQIGITGIPVYYSNGNCKGKMLREILQNYSDIKNIVFVDDNKNNLFAVNKEFYNDNIKVYCYYFKYINI
jgi:hypothetical protein